MVSKSNHMEWIPISLLGAGVYGVFSFMLSFIHEDIKNDESAQLGYGLIIAICAGILAAVMYTLWRTSNGKSAKLLESSLNYKVIAATLLFALMTNPIHAMAINKGGSVGQQVMYGLAIVPVLVLSWHFHGEQLSYKQWVGLALAGSGAFLMGID
jgi:drug/metabolite transporter (DMT)-like permease